ncbi:MAG: hypothetical protein GW795_07060 [Cyanobacteria bacterium]|nr:hypothetical protein [Cyanobacteria bacterium CG_2015-16_32_12]NCO79275.1 hypothetical protein [Cyanobacteria bacterium CG_2015-22_32_23]NCQ05382.1 hypothetical protein [Cyanobacteria bacterium CG_2015-09_32_10]NCQ41639.1 hypothetical protein [Cyanobacteria bacterium CG_2015-04_32_10]NCS85588.1 hypothetical protein [Cyanobacteria bacterium CG_2015-02_32_10]
MITNYKLENLKQKIDSRLEISEDIKEEDFIQDLKTQAAVMYEISVLGEGIRRISA